MTWTLLHDACVHQDTPHVIELAHAHAEQALKVDDHGLTPLHILVLGNPSVEAVTALLTASPQTVSDSDVHGDTPLHLACGNPNADKRLIQMLLDASPTAVSMKNHEGLMPLHMACRYTQNEGVIGLLLENYPFALRSPIKVRSGAVATLCMMHYDCGISIAVSNYLRFAISRWEILPHREAKLSKMRHRHCSWSIITM
jgi:ankyrin repeat protein